MPASGAPSQYPVIVGDLHVGMVEWIAPNPDSRE